MIAPVPSTLRPQLAATLALLGIGLALEAGLAGQGAAWGGDRDPLALVAVAEAARNDGSNRIDVERRERGYYEALLDAGRRLDEPLTPTPDRGANDGPPLHEGGLAVYVDDVRELALRPSYQITHPGGRWSTNSLGLRDREYAPIKPPGTRRIALLGDSIGAGWGVDDEATFEAILERRLDERSRSSGGPACEILNVAVPGLAPGQRWETFRHLDGWSLGIDLVIYEATPADLGWDERRLRALLPRGIGPEAPVYRETLARLGLRGGESVEQCKRILRPHRVALLEGAYRRITADCAERGIPCVWVLIPRVGKVSDDRERSALIDLARRSGFTAILDLSDAFQGRNPSTLAVAPDDYHPNAEGHALIARRLQAELDASGLLEPLTLGNAAPIASGEEERTR